MTCHHRFEHFQAVSDEPLRTCPKCGASVRRLISGGIGLIFKGSGFYLTDYKRKAESSPECKKKSTKEEKSDSSKTNKTE
jgi:putative FmdB family regulatory protein